MSTTVCSGSTANMSCGFIGGESVIPDWRMIRRSSNGMIINDTVVGGADIVSNDDDGLVWVPDTTTGSFNYPNNHLVIGPVDETYNQSSYQCIIRRNDGDILSGTGTLTVAAQPTIDSISVLDGCVFLNVSWTTASDPICGDVSYNVTLLSDTELIRMVSTSRTSYMFGGLNEQMSYSVTIVVMDMFGNSDSMSNQTGMMTSKVPQRPDSPDMVTADIDITNDKFVITVSWQAGPTTRCTAAVTTYSINTIVNGSLNMSQMVLSSVTTINLVNIFPDVVQSSTNYIVAVSAVNDQGFSDPSTPVNFNTFILQSCTAASHTAGFITVSCNSSHELQVTATCYSCAPQRVTANGVSNFNISGLQPGGNYMLIIRAYSNGQVVLENLTVLLNTTVLNRSTTSFDDDSLSNGAIIAIACVVTFILTLIVSVIITFIVTYTTVKRKYDKILEDTTGKQLIASTNHNFDEVELQQNPAYGTTNTMEMDNDYVDDYVN
ncbi:uncharacterized protein [Dysidea avara]|uniref:uncharacterized protein n=1 Tax=Dysidea avara TaxID=196820 RepID=UPI00332D78DC